MKIKVIVKYNKKQYKNLSLLDKMLFKLRIFYYEHIEPLVIMREINRHFCKECGKEQEEVI